MSTQTKKTETQKMGADNKITAMPAAEYQAGSFWAKSKQLRESALTVQK